MTDGLGILLCIVKNRPMLLKSNNPSPIYRKPILKQWLILAYILHLFLALVDIYICDTSIPIHAFNTAWETLFLPEDVLSLPFSLPFFYALHITYGILLNSSICLFTLYKYTQFTLSLPYLNFAWNMLSNYYQQV